MGATCQELRVPADAVTSIVMPMVDRYTLIERIGIGGAGVVYRARDEASGRVVALKQLLFAKASRRATMAALFEREYRTLVRLKHPRIIEVYDYGVAPEGPYYTMELLEGRELVQLRQLPYAEVCRHLRDVASSLALLHAQRLVHRDVSPRNIRLTADGTARLLDFGALASFGTNTEVIGTPPFMAPEVLQELPLDGRTDLYSLGAVGYFCLTGRPAFAAREAHELPRLWQNPPVPPSMLVPDVPVELERLILSMLSQDPLGRPETAASVIDQLTVIAQLPPEPHEPHEQSYFLSSPIVGRGTQIEWIAARIDQALQGKGGEALIEAPAGFGKTRLANELCLAGTLKGTVTLRADAESTRESFGVAVLLGRRLLETCPEIARRMAEPHMALLRALAPELADALGGADSSQLTTDPVERRMRFHSALREWFLAVSRERTLLVCVDNLHSADDDSTAFLASLGRDSRSSHLFVLTTLRTGNIVGAPESVRVLRERAPRLKLLGLDATACELLASGLFGGAPNAGRVGSLLSERSGGVPRSFIELAQLMVQKKIAKYEAGTWVLPFDIADGELPARSEELLSARLSGLSSEAVALAQTLAVHPDAVPLAVALAVSDLPGEGRTYAVLDELLAEQVLISEGDSYRFRHDALREAVLSRMDPKARRTCQLRAAEALLAFDASGVAERVEAALHLMDAGEDRRGARILVTAAREFAATAGTHRNTNQLVRALCRVVRTYDAQGRSDYELGSLLFPLIPLAYYSADWQFILEYGKRAIDIGLRITGLAHAAELEPDLGREEALKRGLAVGAAAFARHAENGIGYDLRTAISATIGMVPASVAVYATCLDGEAVAHVARAVESLTLFGEEHIAYAMHLFANAEVPLVQGRECESRTLLERALERFEDPACARSIGEARAKALQGGMLFTLGLLDSYYFGDRALATARRMESLGVKAWAVTADQIRILYHSLRGESAEVKKYMARVEINAIQGAQSWQVEVYWPALLLNADVLTSDAMAARRRYVQLERRSKEVASLKPQAEAAHAAYLLLRGNVSEAVALYEKLLPSFPIHQRVDWETTRAYSARALNAAGAHARAKAVAEEVVSNMLPGDHDFVARYLEAQRQLALAESGLGNHAVAVALLDELLAKHGEESNLLLVGLLHQARAEVAHRAGDRASVETHHAEMESRFRKTGNPALIAQCERAHDTDTASTVGGRLEVHHPFAAIVSDLKSATAVPRSRNGDCPSSLTEAAEIADDPLEAALEWAMNQTKSRNAYLYVPMGSDLRLVWSSTREESPAACAAELERWLEGVRANDDGSIHDGPSSVIVDATTTCRHRMVALRGAATRRVVGGLILEVDSTLRLFGSSELLSELGRVVEEHASDALGFITA